MFQKNTSLSNRSWLLQHFALFGTSALRRCYKAEGKWGGEGVKNAQCSP